MGTRNLTMVELDNKIKVAQYGQWDGNPLGQGKTILKFILKYLINENDLGDFKEYINDVTYLTTKERDKLYEDKQWKNNSPHLSRDIGAEILDLIMCCESLKKVVDSRDFAGDSLFCEWAYVLDLDNKVLEVYRGFNKDKLTKEDRFYNVPADHAEYEQIKLWKKIKFVDLKEDTMELLEAEWDKEMEEV